MSSRGAQLGRAALVGAACGLVGVAAMTLGEKAEQAVTKRPNSYVPARTLLALTGRSPGDGPQSPIWNHAVHWGTGAVLGALRGVWAVVAIRGPLANVKHTVVRLAFDQTLENVTGVGAPPPTWPRQEQLIDVAHKAVYSLVTGMAADALITPDLESRRGTTSH
ncbi:hypothetical protein [Agrococcus sp. DT81.2]|uniref:hypothetical protein n=1 Tax=Agrococcus sp. DT81.2 TaxID=3393414 RepID=UPI003CE58295